MATEFNGYELSRNWFNWCFENPEKISPNHTAMYFFIIEHCNRLGWKDKFGLPTTMVKDAIGIRNFRTYTNTLNDLADWGFVKMIEKSKNQYSSNIIAIVKNTKAHTKALDKALIKHSTKQSTYSYKSIDSIDKQLTINNEPLNNKQVYIEFDHLNLTIEEFEKLSITYSKQLIDDTIEKIQNYKKNTKYKSLFLTLKNWLKKEPKEIPKGKIQAALSIQEEVERKIAEKYGESTNNNG